MPLFPSKPHAVRDPVAPANVSRWRCAIRNPLLRRAGAALFAVYLLKGLVWLAVAGWLLFL